MTELLLPKIGRGRSRFEREIRSSVLDMLSQRCLFNIQVEITLGHLNIKRLASDSRSGMANTNAFMARQETKISTEM